MKFPSVSFSTFAVTANGTLQPTRAVNIGSARTQASVKVAVGEAHLRLGQRSEAKKAFADAMAPVYAKFANTPKLQELVKRIRDAK